MKRFFLAIFFFIGFSAHASDFRFPQYEKYQLANGLTVYLLEQREVPLINLSIVWKVGASSDGKNYGLANFTTQALALGTKAYSKKALDETLEFYGAELSTAAGAESSIVDLQLNKKDWAALYPLFFQISTAPSFPGGELKKRQAQTLDDLAQMKESPRNMIGLEFARFVFAEHPYGNPAVGTEASVASLSAGLVKQFYNDYFHANNAALIVSGDFDPAVVKADIKKSFGAWKKNSAKVLELAEPSFSNEARVLLVNKPDARESTFMIGGKGIARNDPHFVELGLINTILGDRFTSWLNDELRVNSGLTYGARSRWNVYRNSGTFLISTFTKTETTFPAIDLALNTYHRLWEKGIDDATLSSAKEYAKGQFAPKYETASQLADALAAMFIYDFDESYINDYFKRVDALTVNQANKLAREFFPKDNLQLVLIGNAEKIRTDAAKYGKVTEKDLN